MFFAASIDKQRVLLSSSPPAGLSKILAVKKSLFKPAVDANVNDFRRATTFVDFFYTIKCWPLSRLASAFKTLIMPVAKKTHSFDSGC